MSYSANETASLATKAARGAGAPQAQAARFGQAVLQHLASGRPEKELLEALSALPGGPILSLALDPAGQSDLAQSYRDKALLPERFLMTTELFEQMRVLAHKTYVPASAASRASGAGAGAIDND